MERERLGVGVVGDLLLLSEQAISKLPKTITRNIEVRNLVKDCCCMARDSYILLNLSDTYTYLA
jgi:hypothetical protein